MDRRIFTPIHRSSYQWPRVDQKHTAVEQVNSRFAVLIGFEWHTIRGLNEDASAVRVGTDRHASHGPGATSTATSRTPAESGPQHLSAALPLFLREYSAMTLSGPRELLSAFRDQEVSWERQWSRAKLPLTLLV